MCTQAAAGGLEPSPSALSSARDSVSPALSSPTSLGCEHTVEKIKVAPTGVTRALPSITCPAGAASRPTPTRTPAPAPQQALGTTCHLRREGPSSSPWKRGAEQCRPGVPRSPAPRPVLPLGLRSSSPRPPHRGPACVSPRGQRLVWVGGCSPFPCRCLTSHPSAAMHGRRLYPALHPAPCPGGRTQAGGPCPRGAPSQSPGPGIHACPSSLSAARRWPPARRPRGNPGSPAVGTQVLAVP